MHALVVVESERANLGRRQAGTEALRKTTGRDDENAKLSDENAQLFEPRSELWETSFVSLPGFRHLPLLRMFLSAVVLVVVMLFSSAVDDFWLSFFVTLLCFVAPLLLVFARRPANRSSPCCRE